MSSPFESAQPELAAERLLRQQSALADLTSSLFGLESLDEAARRLLVTAGPALEVDRASLWWFRDQGTRMVCAETWQGVPSSPSAPRVLDTAGCESYLAALRASEAIAVEDVTTDPRTLELVDTYYRPAGVRAALEIPIVVRGKPEGVLCYEQGAPRRWSPGDQLFGVAVAHLMALLAEGAERREAEHALRESEERFRQLAENVNQVLWMTTPDKSAMLYASPAYETIWQRSLAELYRRPTAWLESIVPEDRERVLASAATRQVVGGYDELYRIARPDGGERWIRERAFAIENAAGEIYRIAGVAEDVTDLKLAEEEVRALSVDLEARVAQRTEELEGANQALRESERRLREVIDLVPHFIFAKDSEGRFLIVNRAVAELNGTTVERMLAGTVESIARSPEDAERYLAEDREVIRSGRPTVIQEEVMTDSEGRPHFVQTTKIPFTFSGSGAPAVLGVSIDITERKRAEAERDHLEAQLLRAQKMEAIGTLAGGIAHDFNNILTSILGFADLLGKRLQGDGEAMRDVEQIMQGGRRAADLVRQILTFSRQQRQSRSVIPLQSTLEEALRLLRAAIPTSIEFVVRIDPLAPPVLADATQIHQVMMNLGANAAAAMETTLKARLEVDYERCEVDRAFAAAHPGLKPGPHVCLRVRDNGHGMDALTVERVFEPFFTTKDPTRGTGLGLAVVHGIVRDHDGAVTVESALGVGTTFRIFLPAHAAPDLVLPAERAGLRRGTGEHVLCVDDESANAQLLERILRSLGYQVTSFTSPQAAVAAFRADPGAFDLVITDLTMPRMSGVELGIEVMAARANTPVLLITGFSGSITDEHAREIGMRGLLFKPFSLESLGHAVAQCLEGARPTAR